MSNFQVSDALVIAAQEGDAFAKEEIANAAAGMIEAMAWEFGANADERRILAGAAGESLFTHIDSYVVGSRASLKTFVYKSLRQDVRNEAVSLRAAGIMDGDTYAEYRRVFAKVREEAEQSGAALSEGELTVLTEGALMTLPGRHAWTKGRVVAVREAMSQAPASLNQEDEEGNTFGRHLMDDNAQAAFDEVTETEEQERAAIVRSAKEVMVTELLGHLSERQRTIVEMSFGIGGGDMGVAVGGLLEKGGDQTRMANQRQAGTGTDALIAEILGMDDVASVKKRRGEAVAKLRKLVVKLGMEYPGRKTVRHTPAEAAIIETAQSGGYVRALFLTGNGSQDVLLQAFNDEGDLAEIYVKVTQAIELGILEGEAPTYETPAAPESYSFRRLYGNAPAPAGNVYDETLHPILSAYQPRGTALAEDGEVTVTEGAPLLPSAGVDYSAPLWEVPALDRLTFAGRRDYAAKH
jgi:hypothetical protein